MATNKKPKAKTPAKAKQDSGTWYILSNTVTGEKCVCDPESFEYAQKHEPKAHQWKIATEHKTEEEAISNL